jgi:hypothetical protein
MYFSSTWFLLSADSVNNLLIRGLFSYICSAIISKDVKYRLASLAALPERAVITPMDTW